ncbi:hypothetical protein [Candidatus Electronema sp. JM]|uniref:hypothetical protein n=1 Tax=Candidatus Electronema sp. JM TaxID=3401571 RepID=UPI003AA8B31E
MWKVISATFCRNCEKLTVINDEMNYALNSEAIFLPILRQKLMQEPTLKERVRETIPCSECGEPTYTFDKDLGFVEPYDNYWTVCVNPACSWPGKHSEEKGLYYECLDKNYEKKLKKNIKKTSNCPECGKAMYTFDKKAGLVEPYDGYYTVCINKLCSRSKNNRNKLIRIWSPAHEIRQMLVTEAAEVVVNRIKRNKFLVLKIKSALKAMGEEALDNMIDHPAAKVVIAGVKAFIEADNDDNP